MHPCPKNKAVRLKGNKLDTVHKEAYARDGGRCCVCLHGLPEDHRAHHIEPKGTGGSDTIDNLINLGETGVCECGAHSVYHDIGISDFINLCIKKYGLKLIAQFIMRGILGHMKPIIG